MGLLFVLLPFYPFSSQPRPREARRDFVFTDFGLAAWWRPCRKWLERPKRVLRGATWNNSEPENLLSSYRNNNTPDNRSNGVGFRVVLGGWGFGSKV